MENIEYGSEDTGLIWSRLDRAFRDDPLVSMLNKRVLERLAMAINDQCVYDDKVSVAQSHTNIRFVTRKVVDRTPLGWVGDEFKEHLEDVVLQALLPEGDSMTDLERPSTPEAVDALVSLLEELPAEFRYNPAMLTDRESFTVKKKRNVRKVHKALWELQNYFFLTDLD